MATFTVGFSYERCFTFGLYYYSASLLRVTDLISMFKFEWRIALVGSHCKKG